MGHKGGVYGAEPFQRAVYKMTQSGTGAPAIGGTVENGIDAFATAPSLARTGAGVYTITKTGAFTVGKTFARVACSGASARSCNIVYTSVDVITLNFSDLATPSAADSGDFDLEIKIYF